MMRDIKGYDGYKINESGVVVNKNGHVMRTAVSNTGYLRTSLEGPNGRENKSIHRLVAENFIPNPNNLPVVMHKDNDKLNNHVSNLQWGTQSDNIQQAFDEGRKISPAKIRPVVNDYQVYNDETGEVITLHGRSAVSDLIGYAEISLKNMIGNNRPIYLGPYAGYKIRRCREMVKYVKK